MSRWKLLYKPEQYAKDAIAIIEEQLKTVKSASRKAKLQQKLLEWKTTNSVLSNEEIANVQEEN